MHRLSLAGFAMAQTPLLIYLPHLFATFLVENMSETPNLPDPTILGPHQTSYTDFQGRKWSNGSLNKLLPDVLLVHADGTQLAVVSCDESTIDDS